MSLVTMKNKAMNNRCLSNNGTFSSIGLNRYIRPIGKQTYYNKIQNIVPVSNEPIQSARSYTSIYNSQAGNCGGNITSDDSSNSQDQSTYIMEIKQQCEDQCNTNSNETNNN